MTLWEFFLWFVMWCGLVGVVNLLSCAPARPKQNIQPEHVPPEPAMPEEKSKAVEPEEPDPFFI